MGPPPVSITGTVWACKPVADRNNNADINVFFITKNYFVSKNTKLFWFSRYMGLKSEHIVSILNNSCMFC